MEDPEWSTIKVKTSTLKWAVGIIVTIFLALISGAGGTAWKAYETGRDVSEGAVKSLETELAQKNRLNKELERANRDLTGENTRLARDAADVVENAGTEGAANANFTSCSLTGRVFLNLTFERQNFRGLPQELCISEGETKTVTGTLKNVLLHISVVAIGRGGRPARNQVTAIVDAPGAPKPVKINHEDVGFSVIYTKRFEIRITKINSVSATFLVT